MPAWGGGIFTEEEFIEFKSISINLGANRFALIEYIGQNDWAAFTSQSFFRFSYPLDVSWVEMANSCSIANNVFMRPIRVFFVITDNGCVGKYVDNDALHPYELFFVSDS